MNIFSKISFLVFSEILFIGFNTTTAQEKKHFKKQPNIVLIFADDLGWTDVSTGNTNGNRGSKLYKTPEIDKLASQGMSFTNAYTNQNCAPSRASLISGQYPTGIDNQVFNVGSLSRQDKRTKGFPDLPIKPFHQQKVISEDGVNIFDVLKTKGYQTALVGKSHGTPHPLKGDYGIDLPADIHHIIPAPVNGKRVKSFYLALNSDKKGWTFNSEYVDKYADPYDQEYIDNKLKPYKSQSDQSLLLDTPKHLTDAIGDFSVDYIKEKANNEKPFFLYVPFNAVHSKVTGRKDLTKKYLKNGLNVRFAEYASMIELLDQNVGKINRALKDPNGDGDFSDDISNNTIFIFYSDNGGLLGNKPLIGKKGNLTEGGIRVPLIFRYPNVIAENTVTNQAVHCIDFLPTLADFAGVDISKLKKIDGSQPQYDGVSFASILTGKKNYLSRTNLYWHLPGYMDERFSPSTVIQKRFGDDYYKLFYFYESEEFTMYHLNKDLSEENNLLENPTSKEMRIALSMNSDMLAWLKANNAPTGTWIKNGEKVPHPLVDSVKKYKN
ncbi:sulfatase-like hydrolase/transferase [Seonamhaeicola maritimus]|uniref:Sulfatase-like hydrolase/transferase n=1 Tax=Seonamhaeicola maritimus TaxID=2591822 RepID=A0A5C7GLZ2_9FLAO|nr:sulfatase-like hydrolase/transferase [Seonamhaeicola maritimus]TXG39549.1 sulfatase-like hydrolase/transferase [Seonamhaeicola maritimus]